MSDREKLQERHYYGMCGGGCDFCVEDARYEDERRYYEDRREQDYYDAEWNRQLEQHYEESWWNEWLAMFPGKTPHCTCEAPVEHKLVRGQTWHTEGCPMFGFSPDEVPF